MRVVVHGVGDPELLELRVARLGQEERLSSPQFWVFFSVLIEVRRAPEAETMASQQEDRRGIDRQEDPDSSTTLLSVLC